MSEFAGLPIVCKAAVVRSLLYLLNYCIQYLLVDLLGMGTQPTAQS